MRTAATVLLIGVLVVSVAGCGDSGGATGTTVAGTAGAAVTTTVPPVSATSTTSTPPTEGDNNAELCGALEEWRVAFFGFSESWTKWLNEVYGIRDGVITTTTDAESLLAMLRMELPGSAEQWAAFDSRISEAISLAPDELARDLSELREDFPAVWEAVTGPLASAPTLEALDFDAWTNTPEVWAMYAALSAPLGRVDEFTRGVCGFTVVY